MTITVKDVIKAELLRVCLETTTKFRTKHEKKEKKEKYTSEEIQKVRELYKAAGWDETKTQVHMEMLSILHDAPELKKPTVPVMEPFCVVVCEKDVSGHNSTGNPIIYSKKRDSTSAFRFHPDGSPDAYYFAYQADAVRFATDDEVKTCIGNLTDRQCVMLRSHAIFATIMDAAMAKVVQVEDAGEEEEKDNGEISIYGRSITVTDE